MSGFKSSAVRQRQVELGGAAKNVCGQEGFMSASEYCMCVPACACPLQKQVQPIYLKSSCGRCLSSPVCIYKVCDEGVKSVVIPVFHRITAFYSADSLTWKWTVRYTFDDDAYHHTLPANISVRGTLSLSWFRLSSIVLNSPALQQKHCPTLYNIKSQLWGYKTWTWFHAILRGKQYSVFSATAEWLWCTAEKRWL